eukprot:1987415-Rhodomonas_salina.1
MPLIPAHRSTTAAGGSVRDRGARRCGYKGGVEEGGEKGGGEGGGRGAQTRQLLLCVKLMGDVGCCVRKVN